MDMIERDCRLLYPCGAFRDRAVMKFHSRLNRDDGNGAIPCLRMVPAPSLHMLLWYRAKRYNMKPMVSALEISLDSNRLSRIFKELILYLPFFYQVIIDNA